MELGTAIAVTKAASNSLGEPIKRVSKNVYDKLCVTFTECFTANIEASAERCRKIKNIIYKDQPVNLESQYVSVQFSSEDESRTDAELVEDLKNNGKILISGRAGFGKTMFVKWATLQLADSHEHHKLYPLFVELRDLDASSAEKPLEESIFAKTSARKTRSTYSQFQIGLNNGMFVLILDAVDEISPAIRTKVSEKIRDFVREYPLCSILISTRPEESIESLQELKIYRTKRMDLDQIIEVINRLDYNSSVKEKLILRLKNGLFEDQREFLSNPLLATIMLLTFDHSADIPNKVSAFYKEAFEVLYQRHDAHKGTFRRDHHAGLPMDEFEKVFGYFCFTTFRRLKLEFSNSELISEFREALKYCKIDVKAEDAVRDAIESVSLLQRDGLKFVFVHRSFQEYFTARFLVDFRGPGVSELIDAAAFSRMGNNFIPMLYELNSDLLEFDWLLPKLDIWYSKVKRLKLNTKSGLKRIMALTTTDIGVGRSGNFMSYTVSGDIAASWMSVMRGVYDDRAFSGRFFGGGLGKIDEIRQAAITRYGSMPKSLTEFLKETDDKSHTVVSERDADWLIFSNLPIVFEEIRQDAERTIKLINARRSDLNTFVSTMTH